MMNNDIFTATYSPGADHLMPKTKRILLRGVTAEVVKKLVEGRH